MPNTSQDDQSTSGTPSRLRAVVALLSFLLFIGSWAAMASHFVYFMAIWITAADNPTSTQTVQLRNSGSVRHITPAQDARRQTLRNLMEIAGYTMFGSFVTFVLAARRFSLVGADGRLSPDGRSNAGRA